MKASGHGGRRLDDERSDASTPLSTSCAREVMVLPVHDDTIGPVRFAGRLLVTERARSVIRTLYLANGPQCLVLCWPSGVAHLPSSLYESGPYDVILGHVAGCPIYADLRQLALFRDRRVVLDAPERVISPRPPLLKVLGTAPERALAGAAR